MIDSHAHITDDAFDDETRERIVSQMRADGLQAICEIGADRRSSERALALAERCDDVYCALGTHPHDSKDLTDADIAFYRRHASHPKVVAIGEIGLDYHYDLSARDVQRDAFARQLELADEVELPVCLHVREAIADALDLLQAYRNKLRRGVLLHCYTGSVESLRDFNRFDCYYALGGAVTFRNARKEDVIRAIPRDRLLIETDCPYMTPVPYRGQRNEPKYVRLVLDKIALTLGISPQETEALTVANTLRLYTKINGDRL